MIKLFEYREYKNTEDPVPFCWKVLATLFTASVFLAMAVVCGSCRQDDWEKGVIEEGRPATIRLKVKSVEEMDVATRTAEEYPINDLHVLVYNSDGELIGQKYQETGSDITVNTQSANGCTVYAIANTAKSDLFAGADIHSETYLKKMVCSISAWDELESKSLPMTGKSSVDISAGSQSLSMEVSRMAAKVTLNIGVKPSSGITIKSYKISNVPLCSYYIPRPLGTEIDTDDAAAGEDAPTKTADWANSAVISLAAATTTVDKTFYMFENRRGVVNTIKEEKNKNQKAAPDHATYIEIYGSASNKLELVWRVYLGANNTSNFNIKRNCAYTYNITLSDTYSDTRVTIDDTNVIDLSETGTANCYLVSKPNAWYKFKATVRGNGVVTAKEISPIAGATQDLPAGETMSPTDVELVWETNGHKQVIDSYVLKDGYVYFKTGSVEEGNAVIAVKDLSGILWSWHIWRTSFDLAGLNSNHTQIYKTRYNGISGYNFIRTRYMEMMDRDIGAASNIPSQSDEVTKTFGLNYCYGRKDPFPPTKERGNNGGGANAALVEVYDASGACVDLREDKYIVSSITVGNNTEDITPNINYTIRNPTVFINYMDNDYNGAGSSKSWIYGCYNDGTITTERWKRATLLWGGGISDENNHNYYNSPDTKKTIYDPCPEGWCIPTLEVWSNFTLGAGITTDPNEYNCTEKLNYPLSFLSANVYGREFYINADNTEFAFFPASGYRRGRGMENVGRVVVAWSSSIFHMNNPDGSAGSAMAANHTFTHSVRFGYHADAFPARCVKESSMMR